MTELLCYICGKAFQALYALGVLPMCDDCISKSYERSDD
jgi:NMD protein affecting ribosome stability and mRNA decay